MRPVGFARKSTKNPIAPVHSHMQQQSNGVATFNRSLYPTSSAHPMPVLGHPRGVNHSVVTGNEKERKTNLTLASTKALLATTNRGVRGVLPQRNEKNRTGWCLRGETWIFPLPPPSRCTLPANLRWKTLQTQKQGKCDCTPCTWCRTGY